MKLKKDRRNYRLHDENNKRIIGKSLDECGAGRSILADSSGESLVCLALAYGTGVFVAQYDNSRMATRYDEENPLNGLVKCLARRVEIIN